MLKSKYFIFWFHSSKIIHFKCFFSRQDNDQLGYHYPSFLPSSYDQSISRTSLSSYSRETPPVWLRSPDPQVQRVANSKILPLGRRQKVSHGPRRRKRSPMKKGQFYDFFSKKNYLSWISRLFLGMDNILSTTPKKVEIPLFCYRYYADCDENPEHICCKLKEEKNTKR